MKLLSVNMARSVWIFDLGQFNPKGLNLWPVCEWLINRYKFAGYPKNLLDLDSEKALAFRVGSFRNSKGETVVVALSIYNNGIAADASSSTDDSTEFLQEVAGLVAQEFGLVVPPNVGRAYVSQFYVECDLSLFITRPTVAELTEILNSGVAPIDGKPRKFDFGALQFWTDDWDPASSPAYFRFERRVGVPFSRNQYFSQAALKTREHLAFLEKLESTLRANKSK
jgi:hypothetical protein